MSNYWKLINFNKYCESFEIKVSERIKNFSFKEDNKQKRSILASFIFLSISIRFTYKIDKFGDDGWDFTNIVSQKREV